MSAFTDNSNCHDISNDKNDNNDGFDGNADQRRCSEYHSELVHEFVEITRENISKRITELCYIINQNTYMVSLNTRNHQYGASNSNQVQFRVNTTEFVNIAMSSITPVIQKHTIVQLGACKKIPKSKNEYKKVARNRLNRNKPKFLGNFVFAPLIFDRLYQFCGNYFRENQMVVFVSILEDILSPTAVVRFEQTRAQPLIPYNTFVMENKFKTSCTTLLRYYKLAKQWEIGSKQPNGKKETAKDVWNCFRELCLPKVGERCRNFNNTTPPNSLISSTIQFTTQNPIIPNSPNNHQNYLNMNDINDRQSNDDMESKHDSEYQSIDDNSSHMSISTHRSLHVPPPIKQQQHQPMYDNSRCTVPFYVDDNNNNNNNSNGHHVPPSQLPLQSNYSYQSTHSSSYNRATATPHSMYSSTMNVSNLSSPVSSRYSSRRSSMISMNNDNLPPPVSLPSNYAPFSSQSDRVVHVVAASNNNNNNNSSFIHNNNGNSTNNMNDYGGNDIMNSSNNNCHIRPNTNNDNTYGYNNNDNGNNNFHSNNTNNHSQNSNNYGQYQPYNLQQNNDNNFQNCDNMTTSSNNSSNSDNTANSSNISTNDHNDNNNQIANDLALPNMLQQEVSGDFLMNSPMTMVQFSNTNQYQQYSPLANNNSNNNLEMMIMSPMNGNNNYNNSGGFNQSNWIQNIENTDFDYNEQSNQLNSSFATFQ